jgi:putative permease
MGQQILTLSLASIPGIITLLVYLILVPLLVFFFLKDKDTIVAWLSGFLPEERTLASSVWAEMDQQLGNYVRGKFWEILIVGSVTYVTFVVLDLKYSILLAVLVGISVLVPYLGAAVVTIPVAVVAYFQFGWGSDFAMVLIAYGIIQAIDGNVLVPLLFSEVVNLHPVAIIVSVLVFGGLWGFWGVFFAIPLATLVNAVLRAWPVSGDEGRGTRDEESGAETG